MDDIYKMKLHEEIIITKTDHRIESVRRVPGGWIYRSFVPHSGQTVLTSTFVPWHDSGRQIENSGNYE